MFAIGSSSRRLLNQSTQPSVSIPTSVMLYQGSSCPITSVLYRPLIVSASALSCAAPTLPTYDAIPASAKRSVQRIDKHWTPRSLWWTRLSMSRRA